MTSNVFYTGNSETAGDISRKIPKYHRNRHIRAQVYHPQTNPEFEVKKIQNFKLQLEIYYFLLIGLIRGGSALSVPCPDCLYIVVKIQRDP